MRQTVCIRDLCSQQRNNWNVEFNTHNEVLSTSRNDTCSNCKFHITVPKKEELYLTTAIYYIKGQTPSSSIDRGDGLDDCKMIHGENMTFSGICLRPVTHTHTRTHTRTHTHAQTRTRTHTHAHKPKKKWNFLGLKVAYPVTASLKALSLGNRRLRRNVSEIAVTWIKVWTVGRMVKLYETTFPYRIPRCTWLVCRCIIMKQQDISRQLSTAFLFDILA